MLTLVSKLFGVEVAVEEVHLDCILPEMTSLFASERAAVERALPGRRREFIAGRVLARRAMHRLGQGLAAIPVGADRGPRLAHHSDGKYYTHMHVVRSSSCPQILL